VSAAFTMVCNSYQNIQNNKCSWYVRLLSGQSKTAVVGMRGGVF